MGSEIENGSLPISRPLEKRPGEVPPLGAGKPPPPGQDPVLQGICFLKMTFSLGRSASNGSKNGLPVCFCFTNHAFPLLGSRIAISVSLLNDFHRFLHFGLDFPSGLTSVWIYIWVCISIWIRFDFDSIRFPIRLDSIRFDFPNFDSIFQFASLPF